MHEAGCILEFNQLTRPQKRINGGRGTIRGRTRKTDFLIDHKNYHIITNMRI